MTDRIRSLLIVHYDMHMAKALAGVVVKEHDVYIYLASIGSRVKEFLQNIGIDLVVASQELPDMTGMELFADLSRSDPDVMRVLLLSGQEDIDAEEAVRQGVIHHYLTEPVETSGFMKILADINRRKSDAAPPTDETINWNVGAPVAPPAGLSSLDHPLPAVESDDAFRPEPITPLAPSLAEAAGGHEELASSLEGRHVLKEVADLPEAQEPEKPKELDVPLPREDSPSATMQATEAIPPLHEAMPPEVEYSQGAVEREEVPVLLELTPADEMEDEPPAGLLDEQERLVQAVQADSTATLAMEAGLQAPVEVEFDGSAQVPLPVQQGARQRISPEPAGDLEGGIRTSYEPRCELSLENAQLKEQLEKLRAEQESLVIVQQQNNHLLEENASLSKMKELLEQQTAWMGSEMERLQGEIRRAQDELDKFAAMPKEEERVVSPTEMQYRYGPMDIYEKAAELNKQLSQAQQNNSLLNLSLRNREGELSQVNEELHRLRRILEESQKRSQKELRDYQKNCAFLKKSVDSCEVHCKTLERKNAELFEKLSWVQVEWNELLNSNKLKRIS